MSHGNKATIIRQLRASELPAMISVWKRAGLPYKPRGRDSIRNLREQRKKDPELFLGAFRGDELVGVVLASDDGRRAWINRLAVVPEARRSGIASALVVKAQDAMRRRGRRLFCVQIEEGNQISEEFFAREGYRREQEIFYYTKRELKTY